MSERASIIIADSAGFCFGVRRAVKLAEEAPTKHPGEEIRTLGPIIHNPQVVSRLRDQGIVRIDDIDELAAGIIIIRSHGITRQETEKIKNRRELRVIDATCPYVRRAQEIVADMSRQGYQIIIIGEPDHPEVQGLVSYGKTERTQVVTGPNDLPAYLFKPGKSQRLAVLAQTTQAQSVYSEVINALLPIKGELRCFNTICTATSDRQEEALRLAVECDLMLIIGGRNSANTNRLYELCRQQLPATYHVETSDDIDPRWLVDRQRIGISAGASTPRWLIDDVCSHLQQLTTVTEE